MLLDLRRRTRWERLGAFAGAACSVLLVGGCAQLAGLSPASQRQVAPAADLPSDVPADNSSVHAALVAAPSSLRVQDGRGLRPFYTAGERYEVVVTDIRKDSYLYCYLIEGAQGTEQFYPNRFEPAAPVQTESRQFPGKAPYSLVAGAAGSTETVACYAVATNLGPEPLGSPRIGVADLAALTQMFQSSAGQPFEMGAFTITAAR